VATKNRRAEEIGAGELLRQGLYYCMQDDDIQKALEVMAQHKVRRLPVIDDSGKVQGVITMNDFILAATDAAAESKMGPAWPGVAETLRAISAHPLGLGRTPPVTRKVG
jgi:CBS domain-containing protein